MRLLQRADDRRRRRNHALISVRVLALAALAGLLPLGGGRASADEPPPVAHGAEADRGWTGRAMPNLGLLVTRTGGRNGAPETTALGFEATYTWFVASMADPAPSASGAPFDVGWRSVVRRLTSIAAGAFVQAEFADFASSRDVHARFALGGHFGTFIGVEGGMYYRSGANGYSGALGVQVAPYLSLGAISFAVRLPLWSTRVGDASLPYFDEGFALAVKIAPLHLLALIFDWNVFFNPDYRPAS